LSWGKIAQFLPDLVDIQGRIDLSSMTVKAPKLVKRPYEILLMHMHVLALTSIEWQIQNLKKQA